MVESRRRIRLTYVAAVAALLLFVGLAGPMRPAVARGTSDEPFAANPTCGGKKATKVGTGGNDTLFGTKGNDVIVGGPGNDQIRGLGGDDVICGGGGDDKVFGGAGHDRIFGEGGQDRLDGGVGRDRLLGGDDDDAVLGQGGRDWVDGGDGVDSMAGGAAYDILSFESASAGVQMAPFGFLLGKDGSGAVTGSDATDNPPSGFEQIEGSPFNDVLFGMGSIVKGNGGDDFFFGSLPPPFGFGTNNTFNGGPGNDLVLFLLAPAGVTGDLGTGIFTIVGAGTQKIVNAEGYFGTNESDTFTGDSGNNIINGSDGDDTINGLDGDDTLAGDDGLDTINGGGGNDAITGGDDNDKLSGGSNDDSIAGGDGDDTITGDDGNDVADGGDGAADACDAETETNCEV